MEDYLVDTCGLTRPQALKASTNLSHLKSPANPDTVLAFLAGLGHSSADVADAVVNDPRLLCAGVERTLAPVLVGLTTLGLSLEEVARVILLTHDRIRCRSIVSNLKYYLPIFGSFENFLQALRYNTFLLSCNLERIVKPNIGILRECGLGDCDIAKLSIAMLRMLTNNPERVRAIVACAEGIGVPRDSEMFRTALHAVAFVGEENVAAKLEYLKKTLRWTDAEVRLAVSKSPSLMRRSNDTLQRVSEFLFSEVGLEPEYIAYRPIIIYLSLEGRLRPRHYVLKFLKENELLDHGMSLYTAVTKTEKCFVEKCIFPHKEVALHLAEDYAAACRGELSANFRFT